MKTLLVYMPQTYPTISTRVFKSFIEMTGPDVQDYFRAKEVQLKYLIHDKFPIDLNRNDAFSLAVSNKYSADFLMCCDGDQVFKKDTLINLFETLNDSPEIDGVTGVYYTKTYPHRAVVGRYSPWSKDLENKRQSLTEQGFIAPDGQQTLHFKHLQYFDVTQRVHVFGMGCLLLKTENLKKLEQPFFKYVNGYSTGGDFTFYGHSEDMWFCSQAYQKGLKFTCNPKIQVGHLVEKVIVGNEAED